MTQNEHTLIAVIISFIIYQLIYHLVLKHHPVAKKNMRELSDIFEEYFNK